jgi:hypothetical protein
MQPGSLYYVNFSKLHYVRNDGDTDRLHLVLDLEANDWLRNIFPKMSIFERVEASIFKYLLPVQWELLKYKITLKSVLWEIYKNSYARKIRHKLFPKK